MKKTMVIAIIIVYILSIIAVNFFGLQIKNFDGKIYVKDIECNVVLQRADDSKVEEIPDTFDPGLIWYCFDFVPGTYTENNLETNPNKVTIESHVYPNDADNKRVKYEFSREGTAEGLFYFDEEIATFFFFRANQGLTVTVKAADGSGVSETIFIYPQYFG